MPHDRLDLLVKSVTYDNVEVRSYDLRATDDAPLPPFEAGAHIDLHLANGLVRSYSLMNSQAERHRYVIGVARDRRSRGGSVFVHDELRPGDIVRVNPPRNNFPLNEGDHDSILIAGGIGVTPMIGMADRLEGLGAVGHYITRRGAELRLPFRSELEERGAAYRLHCDDEQGGQLLDVGKIVEAGNDGAHFYCCGPEPMLVAFQTFVHELPPARVHLEYFSAPESAATEGGFSVELVKSGVTLLVTPGRTILDALLEADIDVPFSCQAGVCGTCQTTVLGGIPDHRDLFLTPQEQARNDTMMICCSGSKSGKLTLDV